MAIHLTLLRPFGAVICLGPFLGFSSDGTGFAVSDDLKREF